MALVPKVQWAQRADRLYITIDLQDVKVPKIDISNDAEEKYGKISFSAEGKSHATGAEKHQYALDLHLYKVMATCCTVRTTTRIVSDLVIKGTKSKGFPFHSHANLAQETTCITA